MALREVIVCAGATRSCHQGGHRAPCRLAHTSGDAHREENEGHGGDAESSKGACPASAPMHGAPRIMPSMPPRMAATAERCSRACEPGFLVPTCDTTLGQLASSERDGHGYSSAEPRMSVSVGFAGAQDRRRAHLLSPGYE